jgi:hypothetical protein
VSGTRSKKLQVVTTSQLVFLITEGTSSGFGLPNPPVGTARQRLNELFCPLWCVCPGSIRHAQKCPGAEETRVAVTPEGGVLPAFEFGQTKFCRSITGFVYRTGLLVACQTGCAMAKSVPIAGDEIDLAGKSIHDLSLLRKVDRSKCKVLNLHNNMLSDLNDLPRFLFLTELNVSSNRFKFVPDLSFLPTLTILDVSGNMIESVQSLCFLPALKSLKLAYNYIKSLHGISGANVPNLVFLDIRENPLSASEHEIQSIASLKQLSEISIGSNNLQIIALLFKTCSTLEFVDRKSQAIWRELALTKKRATHTSAATAAAIPARVPAPAATAAVEPVPTPHFDKVAARFKQQALAISPVSPASASSAEKFSSNRLPRHTPPVKEVARYFTRQGDPRSPESEVSVVDGEWRS